MPTHDLNLAFPDWGVPMMMKLSKKPMLAIRMMICFSFLQHHFIIIGMQPTKDSRHPEHRPCSYKAGYVRLSQLALRLVSGFGEARGKERPAVQDRSDAEVIGCTSLFQEILIYIYIYIHTYRYTYIRIFR